MLIKYGEVNNQQKNINNFADYQDFIVSVNFRTVEPRKQSQSSYIFYRYLNRHILFNLIKCLPRLI
jgi:hypothetical protein